MTSLTQQSPDLQYLLNQLKESIKSELNCVEIGKINKFYPDDKTADVEICFKQMTNTNEIKNYPLLIKCPVLGNKITCPVEEGEYCVILFNDRCIDSWYETNNIQVPYNIEKHSISDGLVICGLNNLINKINYDNDNINLTYKSNVKIGEDIKLQATKQIDLKNEQANINMDETGLIAIKNTTQSLFIILNTLLTTLLSLKAGATPATPSFVIDQQTSEALTTLQTNLALLLKA